MATLNLGRIKPVFQGAYNNSTAYVVDDIVTSGDETFICILASTGNATSNASYWTQLAAGGTDVGTTITTQGDLLYRDGSGLQRLAKGTASQQLRMNSSANAPEWFTATGGTILQMKTKQFGTHFQTNNAPMGTSAAECTALTQTMTLSSASNHVWITGQLAVGHDASYVGRGFLTYNHSGISETVVKANPNSWGHTWRIEGADDGGDTRGNNIGVNLFLSPNTTNELTFKFRFMTSNSGSQSYMNGDENNTNNSNDGGNDITSITIMEVSNGISPALTNTDIDT